MPASPNTSPNASPNVDRKPLQDKAASPASPISQVPSKDIENQSINECVSKCWEIGDAGDASPPPAPSTGDPAYDAYLDALMATETIVNDDPWHGLKGEPLDLAFVRGTPWTVGLN